MNLGRNLGLNLSVVRPFTGPAGPIRTYATWNPSDKGAGLILSGGNLTVSSTSSAQSVRSNMGKTTGKWYWEFTAGSDIGYAGAGVCNAQLANVNSWPGADADGYAFFPFDGRVYSQALPTAIGPVGVGVVVGVLMDLSTRTVGFWVNNSPVISQDTPHWATMYAIGGARGTGTMTANFGASPFVYAVPSGYNPGLYTDVMP